jgi:hypothetical protein
VTRQQTPDRNHGDIVLLARYLELPRPRRSRGRESSAELTGPALRYGTGDAGARLARTLGLDRNPLRRASDYAEAWIRVATLVIFLIAGPIAAVQVGQWTAHAVNPGTSARPHAVQAVLLHPAPAPASLSGFQRIGASRFAPVWVEARWQSPGGSTRTGEVLAPEGTPARAAVTIWLDASGRITGPPLPDQSAGDGMLAGLITLVGVACALLLALRLIRRFLNWRRMAAWESEWRAAGPRWTGHKS